MIAVIDGLESDKSSHELFEDTAINACNTGGRIFITSGIPYEEFMEDMCDTLGGRAEGHLDRINNIIKPINVLGESGRIRIPWYLD